MSRIRSIHPGLWTDEEFVSLSAFARLLFMGLWNECDDKGLFEWKPVTLKMRLLPADNLDAAALLDEIEAAGCVRRYEINGKSYGAVRNFAKFQRPKKPNDIYPATAEIMEFAGHSGEQVDTDGHSVPNQFPTSGEIAPQMEDGGGKGRVTPPTPRGGAYAFSGKVVKLNRKDHSDFQRRFHAIPDLEAALAACDAWLSTQGEAKQRNWFGSVAPWLDKRHQEALARSKPRGEPAFSGPC